MTMAPISGCRPGDLEFELDQESIADAVGRVTSVQTIESEIEVPGTFVALPSIHGDLISAPTRAKQLVGE